MSKLGTALRGGARGLAKVGLDPHPVVDRVRNFIVRPAQLANDRRAAAMAEELKTLRERLAVVELESRPPGPYPTGGWTAAADGSLWSEFLRSDQRIADKWVHYFPIYERHFARWRNRPVVFMEIGCGEGGSLQLWKRWLGPLATIVGLDILPTAKAFEEHQIHVRIGDQADTGFLKAVIDEFGPPDCVIDDGSHQVVHQRGTFNYLYPRTASAGVYLVEDLHTSYWPEYGGGHPSQDTFIAFTKQLIDELNAYHSRGLIAATPFTEQTLSMHLYDSVAVFERGPRTPKYSLLSGKGAAERPQPDWH